MGPIQSILLRSFGRPQGTLGKLGGLIMARMNADCGTWVTDLLEIRPNDAVLEVGFGPGVVIQRLAKLAVAGHVAGIDQSREMVGQARARNATAVQEDRVELRHGSVESLPLMTTASTRHWRSTLCSTGRKPSPGCEKYGG
jgi:ubiquinone/menaquinone biosynthesis C-methylase UbiE